MSLENPSCPQCQTELEDDFGIVDCKSCGAVCSVDLEGNVSLQDEVSFEEPDEEVPEENIEEELELDSKEHEDVSEEEEFSLDDGDLVEESDLEEDYITQDSLDEEEILDLNPVAPMGGAAFLKGLEAFTEESGSESLDHIYYDFHVKGLDLKNVKELFIENVADSRLELSEDYLRSLIGDESFCVLPRISFLRMQVVYKRVASLGLELSWSLSEVQQPVAPEVEESSLDDEDVYDEDDEYYEEDDNN